MPDQQTVDQLVALQGRVRVLTKNRDAIIRDTGAAERKLEEALEKLKALGLDASGLDSKQLQEVAEKFEAELAACVQDLSSKVAEGEQLVAKYQQLRSEA